MVDTPKPEDLQKNQLTPVKKSDNSKFSLTARQRKVSKVVYERFYNMRDDPLRKEAEEDWEMADKEYAQYVPVIDPDDWRSFLNLPDSFSAIQTQAQETIDRKSRPNLVAVEDSDEPIAEFGNAVLNYNMDCTNYDFQYSMGKLSRSIRGTSFLMDYWRTDKRIVQDPVGVKDGVIEYKDKELIDMDDDYTEWVPNEFIFIDEKAKHIDEAVDGIRREVLEINEFNRIYGSRPGFENVDKVPIGGELNNRSFFQLPKDFSEQDVEVLHYFNRSTDAYWVVANNVPIRIGPLPSKHKELPFVVLYQYRVPGRFWGMGVPKVIFYLSEERKAIRRLNLDRQKLQLSGAFLHNNSFDIDDEETTLRPGGFISVDTNGQPLNQAIQKVDFGDVSPSYFRTEEIIQEDVRRAHGIDDRIVVSNSGTTATQAAIVKESSLKRLNMISTLDEMDSLKRLGKLKFSNIQFFYPAPRMEQIVDSNEEQKKTYRTVSVKDQKFSIDEEGQLKMDEIRGKSAFSLNKKFSKYLNKSYDVEISAESYTPPSKAIQQTKTMEIFSLYLSNPATMAQLDIPGAMDEINKLNNINSDRWMRPDAKSAHDMKMLADEENMIMAAGQPLAPTQGATEDHTMEHINFTQSIQYQNLPEAFQAAIANHILGEHDANPATGSAEEALGGAEAPQSPPGAPAPSPGINANTSEPQAQPADLSATNFSNG